MKKTLTITCTLLAIVLMLVAAMPTQAGIVALKRDSALCTKTQAEGWGYANRDAIDASFWGLTSATEVNVKDAALWNEGNDRWRNRGTTIGSRYKRMLVSFDLASLGDVTSVEKAQLRLTATTYGGSSPWVAPITSTDWAEGICDSGFPTVDDPGVSFAHPYGTGDKHTHPGSSWGTDGPVSDTSRVLDETEDGRDMGTRVTGSNVGSKTFLVFDVTDIVSNWLVGDTPKDNYGLYINHGYARVYSALLSERDDATEGTMVNPVLFVQYVPEPATMGLLGLGFAGMAALRRRRRK